jgi:hypothetical protein
VSGLQPGTTVLLPRRRPQRRRDDRRADALVHDERRPARRHGPGASRGYRRDPHRQRRPGRPCDELVVRDRPDDGVRARARFPARRAWDVGPSRSPRT